MNIWLVIAAFFTSIVAAVSGAGGGVLLLSFMSLALPVGVVVPLHGVVQVASNSSRFSMLWRKVDWAFAGIAALGCLAGVLLVGSFALKIPENATRLILGFGLLYLMWAPKWKVKANFPGKIPLLAFVVSIVSMLIGPGGILMASVRRREGLAKEQLMADQAALMMINHGMKVASFAWFGFHYKDWLGLLVPMVISSLLGTFVGVTFLRKMSDVWFGYVFTLLVTLIAGKLLVDGLM